MNIFGTVQNILAKTFSKAEPVLIDLGSSNVRIAVGNKEVFDQPACIAVHVDTQSILAIGERALNLLGKAPKLVEISFPIQSGVVAHSKHLEMYITTVLEQIFPSVQLQQYVFGMQTSVAIPASTSPAKKEVLIKILKNVGFNRINLIDSSSIIVKNLVRADKNMQDICIIDIGSQKTEISIYSSGEILHSKLFKWGGVNLTECLQKIIRAKHKCIIGWKVAEITKKEIGTVIGSREKLAIQGKDLVTQASKTVIVDANDLKKDFLEQTEELLDFVQQFFSLLPSEISISVLQKGIYLTGGCSQLEGIDQIFVDRFKCDVLLSQDPNKDIIVGLQKNTQ